MHIYDGFYLLISIFFFVCAAGFVIVILPKSPPERKALSRWFAANVLIQGITALMRATHANNGYPFQLPLILTSLITTIGMIISLLRYRNGVSQG